MKVAVVGSRSLGAESLTLMLASIPAGASEIITGGAKGADGLAEQCARLLGLPCRVNLPDYNTGAGRAAPIARNASIVAEADLVLVFWDGKSRGSRSVVLEALKTMTPVRVIPVQPTVLDARCDIFPNADELFPKGGEH